MFEIPSQVLWPDIAVSLREIADSTKTGVCASREGLRYAIRPCICPLLLLVPVKSLAKLGGCCKRDCIDAHQLHLSIRLCNLLSEYV
jgi:hypothetical protein